MKKIKTINKLLSSLTLLSPLAGVGFNNQYQNTQKVITENNNNLWNNYVWNQTNAEQRTMGDVVVTVEDTKITGYVSSTGEGKLVVDSDITEISEYAFRNSVVVKGIDLSNATSLTTIGNYAFDNCRLLTGSLIIPSTLITINRGAFSNTNITLLDMSNATSLTTIGDSAFSFCIFVSCDEPLPSNLVTLGNNAFSGCFNISVDTLKIPGSLVDLGENAISDIKYSSIDVDKSNPSYSLATNLGPDAYVLISGTDGLWKDDSKSISGFAAGDIVFPENITFINNNAFANCAKITSLDLSQATSLTTIKDYAFNGCKNLSGQLQIPANLSYISNTSFLNTNLTSFKIDSNNQNFSSATNLGSNAHVLLKNKSGQWDYELNNQIVTPFAFGDIDFKNIEGSSDKPSTWTILPNAFENTKIRSVKFQSKSNLIEIGDSAFANCSNLAGDIYFLNSIESLGSFVFENTTLDNLFFLSDAPPSFGVNWKPNITGKVHLLSEESKLMYLSEENFGFTENQIFVDAKPIPTSKSNSILIIVLSVCLGIPLLLCILFILWFFFKKKKTTKKI